MDGNAGIVILAIGNQLYYNYARNLIVSIRAYDLQVPITLLCDNVDKANGIEELLNISKIEIPADTFRIKGQVIPFRVKLLLNKLSPYKKTLYLDADMAWLYKDTKRLFAELDGIPFTIQNNAPGNACIWANTEAMRKAYGTESPVYHLYSECIYFEKCKESNEIFNTALKAFDNPKVNTIPWAGGKASDEFAFIAAIMQTGIKPHKDSWHPIFWYHRDKKQMAAQGWQLTGSYYGYSLGGNQLPEYVKKNYNVIIKAAFAKLGLQYPAPAQDKRRVLAERKNI